MRADSTTTKEEKKEEKKEKKKEEKKKEEEKEEEEEEEEEENDFFLLVAAWVRSRAERPSVSYTKVTGIIARTGHNLHKYRKQIPKQISGNNKFRIKGTGNETDARAVRSDS